MCTTDAALDPNWCSNTLQKKLSSILALMYDLTFEVIQIQTYGVRNLNHRNPNHCRSTVGVLDLAYCGVVGVT